MADRLKGRLITEILLVVKFGCSWPPVSFLGNPPEWSVICALILISEKKGGGEEYMEREKPNWVKYKRGIRC